MGRTLHWEINLGRELNQNDIDLTDIVENNANKDTVWTCETFNVNPISFYYDTTHPEFKSYDMTYESYKKLANEVGEFNAYLNLLSNKRICPMGNLNISKGKWSGFCKTGNNNDNAKTIVHSLLDLSELLKATISLSDENEDFLAFPVILKDGECIIDVYELKQQIHSILESDNRKFRLYNSPNIDKLLYGNPPEKNYWIDLYEKELGRIYKEFNTDNLLEIKFNKDNIHKLYNYNPDNNGNVE